MLESFVKAAEQHGTPEFNSFRFLDFNRMSGNHKLRQLGAPNQAMARLHRTFLSYLRRLPVDYQSAAGGRAGHSTRKALERHRHNRYFCVFDLHDAYGWVDVTCLTQRLVRLDPSLDPSELEQFLYKYCFDDDGRLVTGGPASQELFNLYLAMVLDVELRAIAERHALVYNRYLDDLVFSSHVAPVGKVKRSQLLGAIRRDGFEINFRKSGVYDLAQKPVTIFGLRLELGGRIWVPRTGRDRLRGLRHLATTGGGISSNVVNGHVGFYVGSTGTDNLSRSEARLLEAISTPGRRK